jgi:hypothetical protein
VLASCVNVRAHETVVCDTDPSRALGFFLNPMFVGSKLPTFCDSRRARFALSLLRRRASVRVGTSARPKYAGGERAASSRTDRGGATFARMDFGSHGR